MNTPAEITVPKINRVTAARPTTQITLGCVVIPVIVTIGLMFIFVYAQMGASARLEVPPNNVLLVRASPDEAAPLLARFGENRVFNVIGRTEDWRWLKVKLWDGHQGWALRPLDILVWRIEAEVTEPTSEMVPPRVTPVEDVMITLPATTFTMGSPPGFGDEDERPAHPVSLSAFAIDRTEVTIGQYWQCVLARVCAAPTEDASQTEAHYFNDPAFDNHPAINIPWTEANSYCSWRGKRLPTEAQWELAAGWNMEKGAKLIWPWGSDLGDGIANVGPKSLDGPSVVGDFAADRSSTDVLDLGGNVSEWVFDWYKIDYYSVADDTDPVGPTHRRGEGTGRVVRGGSFTDSLDEARAANRRHMAEAYGYNTVGFRCAKPVQE